MLNLDPERILLTLPGIIIGLAFHEFAHAYAADKLGDPTPRSMGRLTLSPIPHIDPIGLILLIVAGFGWAKPVMVNPRHFKNYRRDDVIVSVAGPLTNLLLAFIFTGLLKLLFMPGLGTALPESIAINLSTIFYYAISINIVLFVFNLLPIPPLDGFHVFSKLVPYKHYDIVYKLEQYSSIILIILIVTKVTSYIIGPPVSMIFSFMLNLFNLR